MPNTNVFYIQFRWTLLLAFFSGTYIPRINTILPKYFPTFQLYVLFLFSVSFNGFYYILNYIQNRDELDFATKMVLITSIFYYLWALSTSVYFIHRRDDMQDLITTWCHFQPELWPESRKIALNKQTQIARKKISQLFLFYLLPYGILLASVVFQDDSFGESISDSKKPNKFIVIMESIGIWCIVFWYTMVNGFFFTVLRLILVELEYMEASLTDLFSSIKIHNDGSIFSDECPKPTGKELTTEDYCTLCLTVEERLMKLITYHVKILKFSHKVAGMFGPLFFVQVTILSTIGSVTCYIIALGTFSADVLGLITTSMAFWSYVCLIVCSIGGEIYEKSSRLRNAAFYSNWMAYPIRIQKLLLPIIAVTSHRPMTVNPLSVLPMVHETFFTLISLQYKFFMFISDTMKH